ncbi:hypothetical protein FB451DRAFT_76333 [Mycena latifolia]|nr:hypothetical protein FB451DRAFT_76333 [Mycena latifolia]
METIPERLRGISYSIPPKHSNGRLDDPQLILIFGWLGATLPHLMKYAATYSKAYPAAAQVVVLSDVVAAITGSRETNINRQRPIVEKLVQLGLLNETPPRLLLHVFSGGGASQLLWLALALKAVPPNHARKSATCLILDSTPGSFHHADLQRVLTVSLKGLARYFMLGAASVLSLVLKARSVISGHPLVHNFIRDGLNNPKLLPWMDETVPRLYLYSDADQQSPVGAVQEHIAAAKKLGFNVREELFLGSPHVQHSKRDPIRYWGAVHSRWGEAVRAKL